MSYNAKNYTEQGGEVTHIGGKLVFEEGGSIAGFPGAANQEPVTGNQVKDVKDAVNALLIGLKNAGIMVPDSWNVSVLACPTPAAMPTSETTANSGHATVTIDGTEITITLNCKVSELADANHGETWGKHKWLGFGVRTGLGSVVGMKFTDDTGASVTLSSVDADEAATLGLTTPGDLVLYIKAEQAEYPAGEKYFTLKADGYAETTFTMKIVEPTTQEG